MPLIHHFLNHFPFLRKWAQEIHAKAKAMRTLLSKTPLFGHMVKCTYDQYWDAFVEYSNSLMWSTMPFWLGAIILFFQQGNGDQTFLETLTGTFRNGELLVFTIATLTPIIFMTLFEYPKDRYPHRLALGTLASLLIVCCAALFSLQKGHVPTKAGYVYYASLGFTAFAVFIRYVAIVYNKAKLPHTTEKDLVEPTTAFVDDFDRATRENP